MSEILRFGCKKISTLYTFNWMFRSGPTIGDVLAAKDGIEGKAWTFKTTNRNTKHKLEDGSIFITKSSVKLIEEPLPKMFSDNEWITLGSFNKAVSNEIHDRKIPKLVNGNFFIMLSKELHQRTSHSYMKLE